MRRITPHLCNLLSANQFFDTLPPPRRNNRRGGGLYWLAESDYSQKRLFLFIAKRE